MAVPFTEIEGSPTVSHSGQNLAFKRVLQCPWDRWQEFFAELTGGFEMVGGTYTYRPPAHFPGSPQAVVTSIDVTPFSEKILSPASGNLTNRTNAYQYARFTVGYGMQDTGNNGGRNDLPAVPDGTTVSYERSYGAEYLTTPGSAWLWEDDEPVTDDVSCGVLIPTIDFKLTWANVPAPPWETISALSGVTNSAQLLEHGPEQVLFMGCAERVEFQIGRAPRWSLDYMFKVRAIKSPTDTEVYGWNHLYRREPIGDRHWLKVKNESGDPIYKSANLLDLFQLPSVA